MPWAKLPMGRGWLHRPHSSSRVAWRSTKINAAYCAWVTRESGDSSRAGEMPARCSRAATSSSRERAPSRICSTCWIAMVWWVTVEIGIGAWPPGSGPGDSRSLASRVSADHRAVAQRCLGGRVVAQAREQRRGVLSRPGRRVAELELVVAHLHREGQLRGLVLRPQHHAAGLELRQGQRLLQPQHRRDAALRALEQGAPMRQRLAGDQRGHLGPHGRGGPGVLEEMRGGQIGPLDHLAEFDPELGLQRANGEMAAIGRGVHAVAGQGTGQLVLAGTPSHVLCVDT
eukprot:Opistho-2@94888